LRVLICGRSRVTGRISPILNRLGAEVLTSTELPSGDNLQTMGPELILLHLGDEQLQALRQSAASIPLYLLLDGYDQDWSLLSQSGVCGYISVHASTRYWPLISRLFSGRICRPAVRIISGRVPIKIDGRQRRRR